MLFSPVRARRPPTPRAAAATTIAAAPPGDTPTPLIAPAFSAPASLPASQARSPPEPGPAPQYNMVKLIPAKEHSEMFGQYREPTYDDWMVDDNN